MPPRKIVIALLGWCLVLSSCAVKEPLPAKSEAEAKNYSFYFRQGVAFLNRGDYADAVGEFGKAIVLNPNSARAYNLQGVAFFQLKNYKDAEKQFQKAVALDGSYIEAGNNLGSLYFAKRQFDQAKEMFLKTLSLSPDSVSALYSLGTLLLLQGKGAEGMSYLSHGIELDPDFLDTHKALVLGLPTPGSEMAEVYFTYAKVYAARGNVDKTVEFLKKAQRAGFINWGKIREEKEFDPVRDDPKIKEFIR
jgi:tetratricopeptide (TPR) repeat protein